MACVTTLKFRRSSRRRRHWLPLGTTTWVFKREFRPTRTIFSRDSELHGIQRETVKLWSGRLMECSMTIHCLGSIFSATLPTAHPVASLLSPGLAAALETDCLET